MSVNKRLKAIEDNESFFLRLIRKLIGSQRKDVQLYITSNLNTTNSGVINNSFHNIRAAYGLAKLDEKFTKQRIDLASKIGEKLIDQIGVSTGGFERFAKRTGQIEKSQIAVTNKMREYLGYRLDSGGKGSIIKEGLLNETIVKADYMRQLTINLLNQVQSGQTTIGGLVKNFNKQIEGTQQKPGLVESWFRTTAFDTFAKVDRSANNEMAVELELNWGVFSGGIIKTTRPFCRCKNRGIYTRDKVKEWINEDFAGKTPNYDPFTDMGGYNCRHLFDWVDEITAKAMSERNGREINEDDCSQ
jgi:hypothetical protein